MVVSDEIYERLIYGQASFRQFCHHRYAGQDWLREPHDLRVNWRGGKSFNAMSGLADRLDHFAAGSGHRDGRSAKPGDFESLEHQPICRSQGAGRPAGVRRHDAGRIREAAAICRRPNRQHPGIVVSRNGRCVLRLHQHPEIPGQNLRREADHEFHRVVPGAAGARESGHVDDTHRLSGAEGYVRVSFATSLEELAAGFDRIESFLKSAK